jgi:ferritin-like protein
MRAYCEVTDLGEQVVEAAEKKDEKEANALMDRIDELEKAIGPEYRALFDALYEADPNSKDIQQILSMFVMLDQSCPK